MCGIHDGTINFSPIAIFPRKIVLNALFIVMAGLSRCVDKFKWTFISTHTKYIYYREKVEKGKIVVHLLSDLSHIRSNLSDSRNESC